MDHSSVLYRLRHEHCATSFGGIDAHWVISYFTATAANPPHASAAGEWNRQTDGRTQYRFMDPALRNMRTVPIKRHRKRQADKRRQVDVTYRSHQPTVRLC